MADKGSFSIRVSLIDQASGKLAKLNKNLAASQRPMKRLNSEFKKFGDITGLKSVTENIEKFTVSAVKAGAAVAGIAGVASLAGIFSMAQAFASAGKAATNTSRSLGLTTDVLSKFENAARFAGLSAGQADSALAGLQKTSNDAKWGQNNNALKLFQKMGVSVADDLPTKIKKISAAISQYKDPQVQKDALDTLGIGQEMLPLILQYQRLNALSEKYGYNNTEVAKAGDRLSESLTAVQVAGQGVGNALMVAIEPVMTPLLSDFGDMLKHLQGWIQANQTLIQTKLKEYLGDVRDGFRWLKDNLPAIKTGLEALIFLKVAGWGLGIASSFIQVAAQ